ncbi:MAG: hypothetical protein HYV32_03270 [Candidatus Kerfeldbacteria bacterium]|nr:hypothetical protein [Candidatus Kerfeldbacteria bacterium]
MDTPIQKNMPTAPAVPPIARPLESFELNTPDGINKAIHALNTALDDNDNDTVFHLVNSIQKLISTKYPELDKQQPGLYAELETVMAEAKWFVIGDLAPTEVENVLSRHGEGLFKKDFEEILRKLKRRLLIIDDYGERDVVKQKYREALSRSTAHIGKTDITIGTTTVEPSIASWLHDWKEFLATRKPEPLLIVEYMNSSKNVQALSADDKERIEHLLKFDHKLSLSSKTPEGSESTFYFDDPVTGTVHLFDMGVVEDTHVPIPEPELKAMRFLAGLDDHGKPLPISKQVKKAVKMYAQPVVIGEEKTVAPVPPLPPMPLPPPPKKTVQPPASPLPLPQLPTPQPLPPMPVPPLPVVSTPAVTDVAESPLLLSDHQYHTVAQHVLGEYKLLFESLELEKRFLSIVVSYLRGVRSKPEARDALTRPSQEGGVNIPAAQVDTILHTADELYQQALQGGKETKRVKTTQPSNIFAPTLAMVQEQIDRQKKHDAKRAEEQASAHIMVEDMFANMNPIFDTMDMNNTNKKSIMTDIVHPGQFAAAQSGASFSHDSQEAAQPVVMGPLEELQNMNLEDFRRLAEQPQDAAKHIIDKLALLEEESLSKKAEGMQAWFASPLHQLYLSIGKESLEKTVPVEEIIRQWAQSGKDTLMQAEFDAISDLNRQLRY